MLKFLAIMPISIGGRLTTSSIIDGLVQNGFEVKIIDELKEENKTLNFEDFNYIIGYDFSPIIFKIKNKLNFPCIAYFSDDIHLKTSGIGYEEYNKYLNNKDIYVFYWDRELTKKEKIKNIFYQPHFVNCEIYKDFTNPIKDVLFMGRFDTDLRLNLFLELNKKLNDFSFSWYAIEKHFKDAVSRCENDIDKNIIKKAYCGFIDNEKDMANVINEHKIVYNVNAQGLSSLNYRTIQTLACKRLIISDLRAELDIFKNLIPTYSTSNELAKKIKFYLNNKKEYDFITQACQKIILEKLNSKICVQKMIEKIEKDQS